ncbi:MAG TPA: hypothetical protein VFI31_02315, partial [Pirellulales bacterium]|nr:hypothetical protein [Pirellulales bacterium]
DDAPAVAIPGHRRDDPVRLNEPRVAVLPQPPNHNDAGQSVESNRLRLKIAASLASTDDAGEEGEASPIDLRKQMVHIEKMLRESETVLNQLVEESAPTAIDDPQLQQLKGTDERLANVEQRVGELRKQSKDTPYAFAGLQMVEIAGSHVSPARDRLFAIVRQPESDPDANLLEALHRVGRARELLAELLVRFDQAVRELQLADSLEEVAKMYEVYVAGAQRLLRAQSTPAANPLERKMAILELDQEYLNRLREVLEMRRDLMSELGRMLGDDPRLRGKYLDLVKRRQDSLRDAFHSLYQRQTALAAELAAWRQLDETQREDIWAVAAELRLQDLALLAKDAAQLEEQVTSQLPLGLDATGGAAAVVLDDARQLAVAGRAAAIKARRLIRDSLNEDVDLKVDLDAVEFRVGELDAALERLAAEGNDDETAAFVAKRLADSRALAEKLACRSETASHLRHRQYAGLAQVDQRLLAMQTQQLRTALQNAGDELNGQFDGKVPPDILGIARQLDVEIEAITFNQTAAAFSLSGELADAETQQLLALAAFQRAEELFDRMRRMVIEVLDQNDPDNPTAADLEDPTLDEILERLEREPDLSALLGIPDRPRNLRVLSDWMLWNQQSNGLLGTMEELARRTKQQAEELVRPVRRPGPGDEEKKDEEEPVEYLLARQIEELRRQAADPKIEPEQADKLRRALERLEALREKMAARQRDDDLTEQEWQQVAEAEMAEEMLEEKIDELRRQAALPETDSEEAEKLRQAAERLEALRRRLADQNRGGDGEQKQPPERLRPGALRSMIEALLAAETLNVEQWNRVLSSLDDGLWQVRRRVPPDQYRRAIEQYQEQIRRLRSWEASDATSP